MKLPPMRMIQQRYTVTPKVDVSAVVNREWEHIKANLHRPKGSSVAIGVGSRGITDLADVVRAVVAKTRQAGYAPFITPAMGSHGGATAEGQIKVLTNLGFNPIDQDDPVGLMSQLVQKKRNAIDCAH